MDYAPANIMPKGVTQGDYFSTTIGPYDMWAIEYGYKPLSGGTDGEVAELKKIAARMRRAGAGLCHRRRHARHRSRSAVEPLRHGQGPDRVRQGSGPAGRRAVAQGDRRNGQERRRLSKGPAGVRRAAEQSRPGDALCLAVSSAACTSTAPTRETRTRQAPFVVVEPAKQREALALLEEQVFSDKPFQFPPDLYNHLAATRWSHWGSDDAGANATTRCTT